MAAIEHLGSPGAPAWFVLRGRVWEGDEERLIEQALAADGDVTVDLTEVGEITIGGCWALRRLADLIWERGHRVTVLISSRTAAREALERTGTLSYARMHVEETPA
jgi:hypothetical protein